MDELSVLAVNAALPSASPMDDGLAESARVAVERAEQVGTELDATLADARAVLAPPAGEEPPGLDAVGDELEALIGVLAANARTAADVDALLRATLDDRVHAAVQAAVDSARRLRQTAELVASEAAAVTSVALAGGEA
ncbi:MAG: hypothetical protein U0802_07825 [Candidatus Binatia bacterium]